MAAHQSHIRLAQSLPPKLLRFFARYPPANAQSLLYPMTTPPNTALNVSPSHIDASTEESNLSSQLPPTLNPPNPFLSQIHPITGTWHNPKYSLRRQADLVKLARANGVEELLPFTVKGTDERIRRREEHGLRVKGTGVGQKVRGKEWERTMKGRLDRRKQAMLEMPQLIQIWKQKGHGRGWKKFPK